jgi:hypothetical protein
VSTTPPAEDPAPAVVAEPAVDTERMRQRRFGLTSLILIVGGGAAATRVRSNRR